MIASHLGLSVRDCMERVTHREYLMWLAYFEEDWNTPSRSDYYLMQIAQEVRALVYAMAPRKKSITLRLTDFLLKFTKAKAKPTLSPEQRLAAAKARWFGITGYEGKK